MVAKGNSSSRKCVTLITGANGEVGQGLIHQLCAMADRPGVVVLDRRQVDGTIRRMVDGAFTGDILDTELLDSLASEYEFDTIFHLAALLSTHAELHPETAHQVNVQGTINLLKLATEQGRSCGQPVKFIYPSSIAVYGLPDLQTKRRAGAVREDEYLQPTTMYGCNKLYCELLGGYYAGYYQQLTAPDAVHVDFRGLRFPGLISAHTLPTGGTSDFAPEMVHAAAHGKPYAAFVRADARIPFMVMPDAIKALLMLSEAPRHALKRYVYNVSSFSLSAMEVAERVKKSFPAAEITFEPDRARQGILDTWPADMGDAAARSEWGWSPDYDVGRAFDEYITPEILRSLGVRREAS